MKKFLIIALALGVTAGPVLAGEFAVDAKQAAKVEASLSEAKQHSKNVGKYPSTGASQKGSVKFSFKAELEGSLVSNPEYTNTFKSTKECRAVVIDKNWLLASRNCAVNDDYITHEAYRGAGAAPDTEKYKVTDRYYSDYRVTVDSTSYPVDVFGLGNEFLIYAKNTALVAKLNKLPKANILVTDSANSLSALKDFTLIVRRDSRYWGEVSDKMEIETICTKTSCVKVENKILHPNGAAGDPMFLKLDNGQEFVVAFNATQNYSGGNNTGREYKTINAASAEKIKEYVKKYTPSSYNAIAKKIVKKINVITKSYSFE